MSFVIIVKDLSKKDGDEMSWLLKWNDIDGDNHDEETFEDKELMIERLKELKEEYLNELEWEFYEVEKCKCCGYWIRKGV